MRKIYLHMRSIMTFLAFGLLFSCSKGDKTEPAPTPAPPNNGPIGGTYTVSALSVKSYDTIAGSGLNTINEYTTVGSNLKGTITITATSMNSKGLMYEFTRNGTKKEVNTSNGNTVTTNYSPATGTSGAANTSYTSDYSISTSAGEITVNDAQYLFNSAFLLQPANKKHNYTLNGNTLKITSEAYDAASKTRSVNEATFTKQ